MSKNYMPGMILMMTKSTMRLIYVKKTLGVSPISASTTLRNLTNDNWKYENLIHWYLSPLPRLAVPGHVGLRAAGTGTDVGLSGTAGSKGEASAEEGGLRLVNLLGGREDTVDEFVDSGIAFDVALPSAAQPVYVP